MRYYFSILQQFLGLLVQPLLTMHGELESFFRAHSAVPPPSPSSPKLVRSFVTLTSAVLPTPDAPRTTTLMRGSSTSSSKRGGFCIGSPVTITEEEEASDGLIDWAATDKLNAVLRRSNF